MTVSYIRVLFVLLAAVIGFQIGPLFRQDPAAGIIGAGGGAAIAALVIWLEMSMAKVSLRGLSAAVFGLLLAFLVFRLVSSAVDLFGMDEGLAAAVKLVLILVLCYLGMVLGMRGRDEFNVIIPYIKFQRQKQSDAMIILDTSVIIDGRI